MSGYFCHVQKYFMRQSMKKQFSFVFSQSDSLISFVFESENVKIYLLLVVRRDRIRTACISEIILELLKCL